MNLGRRVKFIKGAKTYNFLLDRNVERLARFFPRGRVKTVSQVNLPESAPDLEIVKAAWNGQSTIVTADKDDFPPAMVKFRRQQGGKSCPCLFWSDHSSEWASDADTALAEPPPGP